LRVELELDARRQERETFEQPLDVGIGDLEAFHAEPAGDLRKLARELRAHLADVLQLAVVVAQETRVHYACPSLTVTLPVSRSISVLRYSACGDGFAHSSPSMRNTRALRPPFASRA